MCRNWLLTWEHLGDIAERSALVLPVLCQLTHTIPVEYGPCIQSCLYLTEAERMLQLPRVLIGQEN